MKSVTETFFSALKLGLTSFGGPVAHLGYFHAEYVERRKWLDEAAFGELLALGQVLPGPTSSQLILGIGTVRGGLAAGIAAWVGFALPSALAMLGLAWLFQSLPPGYEHWIHGLKIVAFVVVAQAVLTMGKSMASGRLTGSIAFAAAACAVAWSDPFVPPVLLATAGLAGFFLRLPGRKDQPSPSATKLSLPSRTTGTLFLVTFALLSCGLPLLHALSANSLWSLADAFFSPGALVFGGGHVVLPLLDKATVASGLVPHETFLAGYGAAQALPGPLFTFAGYLGWIARGPAGGLVALTAIFLPGFLLYLGVLPFWSTWMRRERWKSVLAGVNAAVVGILGAALWDPLAKTALTSKGDFGLAALLFAGLTVVKMPVWAIVLAGALGGTLVGGEI